MNLRGVFSDAIVMLDGTAQPGDVVKYRLERVGWDSEAHVLPSEKSATIQEDGSLPTTQLWASQLGGRNILCILPNGTTFRFALPPGDDDISLETLHLLYSTPEPSVPPALLELLGSTTNDALGANLVGYMPSGASTGTTVQDKLRTLIATSDNTGIAALLAAAAGTSITVDTDIAIPASITIPASVGLQVEHGGRFTVATGQTLTIEGPLDAGRFQIFAGPGSVAGTPQIDESFPEWFGAVGDGVTNDTVAIEKATVFGVPITGQPGAHYRMVSTRVQHTPLDLYSRGKVQDYSVWVPQFPNGMWYGVRLPSGAVVQDMAFVLTCSNTGGKLHSAFACGDPTSATRVSGPTIRRCQFEVASDAPVLSYRTNLREPVAIDQTTWVLDSIDGVIVGDAIRLTLDDLAPELIFITTVVSLNVGTNTVTVAAGPDYEASAGNLVRGPYVAPISVLLAQSADGTRVEDNRLVEALDTGTADKLIGVYGFDLFDVRIEGNYIEGVEKLAGLDYCTGIQFNRNHAWNSGQLLDLNKACFDATIDNNLYNRDEIDTTGDAIIEMNGSVGVIARGNIFERGTRGFIVNTKGLVYRTWAECMAQNTAATEEGMEDRQSHAYHSVWKKIKLLGNHHEWMARHAIYIGDNWKAYTTERVESPTCGVDLEIDDTAINCGNFTFYGRWNGIVQVQEGKQVRIRMHIDNPDAIRGWTAASVATGQREIQLASVAGVSVGQPLRLVQDTEDNASVYTIASVDAGSSIVTVSRDIVVAGAVSQPPTAAASGTPVWIGPGNGCGVSVRSWLDENHWMVDDVPTYAVGADDISDCEIQQLAGSIKNCASYGVFGYQARLLELDRLMVENCGSRDRNRYAMLVLAPDPRGCHVRGTIEIDNRQELNQAGSAAIVDYGLEAIGTNLNDNTLTSINVGSRWSATEPFLWLWSSHLRGHAIRDLDLDDDAGTTDFVRVRATDSIIPAASRYQRPFLTASDVRDFGSLANGATGTAVIDCIGAAVGDPAVAGFTAITATGWTISAKCHLADHIEVRITNNTGATVDLPSGTINVKVFKMTV